MAMGLSGTTFCDFVVYTFTGMLIVRVKFDEDFFVELILKLNSFYKGYLLPKISEIYVDNEENLQWNIYTLNTFNFMILD